MATIKVDFENGGEVWWDAMHARADAGDPWALWVDHSLDLVTGDTATLPDEEATELAAWCASLPGWDDGPDYAPHPLLIEAES